ncbi:MAG TPA: vanadium-dependent haloperoxidase [Cyclobacteriaceae bacterium]|nr:vanadium-dependent haloperoxidase [Cyclobacteriaceae bacterium]
MNRTTRHYSLLALLLITVALLPACKGKKGSHLTETDVALAWADMALYITKNTPANSPTFASRCFGYIGLTMYESIVHGYPQYNSLDGQLNGMPSLPQPGANDYNWILALNAGQASILKSIYVQTSDANKHRVDSLEELIFNQFSNNDDNEITKRSVDYGRSIAQSIFEWSKTDGGHRAYLRNFDKSLKGPTKPGSWEPTLYGQSFSHFPLHPYWGQNRNFVKANSEMPLPEMIPYDTSRSSLYYQQYLSVYQKSMELTQEDKEVALWWGDDPSETYAPPGHSYYIATVVLKKAHATLPQCAETFARIGIGSADAFIDCWRWKYNFWSERPSSFIPRNIDKEWQSFWPDPPFPAFPSGHATQAATTATILTDLFGENFTFADSSHVGRKRDDLRQVDFKARTYSSFWQVAEETANSRFYGGIHTPQDNDVGLAEGKKIAQHINSLNWHNSQNYAAKNR